jgi:GTPase
VRFQFCYRPEYLNVGAKVIIREGRTKAIGRITQLFF